MEKMFKRTLIGAAVASLTLAGSVQARPATETIDLYGQIAISVAQNAQTGEQAKSTVPADKKDKVVVMDNESRVGVRGSAQFERGPKLIWQLEGGNVGDDGKESGFGVRDTYGGFEFEDAGRVRFGRMLTPMFEVLDGYTGQSSGAGFNVGNTGRINYDRQSNFGRYDSAVYGGFSFAVGGGRGNEDKAGSNVYSGSAQFQKGVFTGKVAYEKVYDVENDAFVGKNGDGEALIAGLNLDFDSFGGHLAYITGKATSNEGTGAGDRELKQSAYKVGAYYTGIEHWTFNLNYAMSTDLERNGVSEKNSDQAITGQAMYALDPLAVVYVRVVHQTDSTEQYGDYTDTGWRVGMEYYF
ncbi:porin [Vibrio nomapromontoriensis]|uniref:porin n=1 Tax=Vibrio nomapromontoriensis TaxID=2910246 RepID=UPI003D14DCCD